MHRGSDPRCRMVGSNPILKQPLAHLLDRQVYNGSPRSIIARTGRVIQIEPRYLGIFFWSPAIKNAAAETKTPIATGPTFIFSRFLTFIFHPYRMFHQVLMNWAIAGSVHSYPLTYDNFSQMAPFFTWNTSTPRTCPFFPDTSTQSYLQRMTQRIS